MAGRSVKFILFIEKYNRAIGIRPPRSNQIRRSFNRKNVIFVIGFVQGIITKTAFFLLEAESVRDIGMSVFFWGAMFLGAALYLIPIWQMKNISEFIDNCEKFIETRRNAKIAYKDASEKIELLCKWFCTFALVTLAFCVLSVLIFSIFNYCVLHLAEKSFYLIFPTISFPYDWRTPHGYAVAWISEAAGTSSLFFAFPPVLSLIFASCWLFVTIADDDLTQELAIFNNDVKKSDGNDHAELMRRFCGIIQSYSDAKELVNEFNEIYRFSLFAFISWGIFGVCSSLLTLKFQLADDSAKPVEIIISVLIVFWTFFATSLVCESGEQMTGAFVRFYEELNQCDWYMFPSDVSRLYLTFLLNVEQSINIQCYGRILCTRDTLKKITNSGFSYFTMIHQMERA